MTNRLDALSPRTYRDNTGAEKTAYTRIGTAFETRNGWAIRLDALPLPSMGERGLETTILLMQPKEQAPTRGQSQRRQSDDDSIPF